MWWWGIFLPQEQKKSRPRAAQVQQGGNAQEWASRRKNIADRNNVYCGAAKRKVFPSARRSNDVTTFVSGCDREHESRCQTPDVMSFVR
jgi:hypothetical protein